MLAYARKNESNNINISIYINIIKMSFNIWLKRLLIVSLLITSLAVAIVVGNKSNINPGISEVKSGKNIWNPSELQFISEPDRRGKSQPAQPSPAPSQTPKLRVKSVDDKSKQNKQNDNSSTANKIAKSKIPNKQQSSNQENQLQVRKLPRTRYQTTKYFQKYKPNYTVVLADPSNYGDRYSVDLNGSPVRNQPIVVIHETSNSASSAINTFKTHHTNDNQQVSYHSLITLDGTIVYLVPPEKRAYGAGNSVFEGIWGIETVKTNPSLPPSVNNFAYHVSLETPVEAHGKYQYKTHSGYTDLQYKSLAWLIAQSNIPDERITTHRAVDRSGQRIDPRSFDFSKFFDLLHKYRQPIATAPQQTQQVGDNLAKTYDPA